MSELKRQSPLVELSVDPVLVDAPTIKITEQACSHYILRGHLTDGEFVNAVKKILDIDLPEQVNTIVRTRYGIAIWSSPDEWYLLTQSNQARTKIAMLKGALLGVHALINDVSSGQTVITLSGDRARDVLAKATTYDIHPRNFVGGRAVQTVFAKTNVIIVSRWVGTEIEYDLLLRRSFADAIANWLIDSCFEYLES